MSTRIILASGVLVAVLASCTAPPSKRCRQICETQSSCAKEDGDQYFDLSDCVARCDTLIKSNVGKTIVEGVAACGAKHPTNCGAFLQCTDSHTLPPLSTACRRSCEKMEITCGGGSQQDLNRCMGKCADSAQKYENRVALKKWFDCEPESDCELYGLCTRAAGAGL